MGIVVTAPGTVDDADTTELYAHQNHFQIISDAYPYTFYQFGSDMVVDEMVAKYQSVSIAPFSSTGRIPIAFTHHCGSEIIM